MLYFLLIIIFILIMEKICFHKYEIIKTIEVRDEYGMVGYKYVSKCEHCGKIKTHKTY